MHCKNTGGVHIHLPIHIYLVFIIYSSASCDLHTIIIGLLSHVAPCIKTENGLNELSY